LRPGHPTTFGTRESVAVFALPGNPVAVVATLCGVFGPGLRRCLGQRTPPRRRWIRLGFDHRRRGERVQLLPVRLEEREFELPQAAPTHHHGSGDFVSLARADGFAVLEGTDARFERGAVVEFLPAEI
jgi:molybdopterin biosynthesis enzyme